MRGRLIFPFLAELHRLDTHAMATTDPDGTGPLSSSYDDDFKEPVRIDAEDDGVGAAVRHEHTPVRLPCQIEPQVFDLLRMEASGGVSRSDIDMVFHFKDLERHGLVDDTTGDALIRPSDRLGAIYDTSGALVQEIRTPPGLFVKEARPMGFGLGRARPQRNLLIVSFHDRRQAAQRVS